MLLLKMFAFAKIHVLCLVFLRKELNTPKHSRGSISISWVTFSLFIVSGKFLWYVCYRIFSFIIDICYTLFLVLCVSVY